VAATPTKPMSFAEFEQLPDPPAGHFELRHGELTVVAPPRWDHFLCRERVRRLLADASGAAWLAGTEMAFRPTPEGNFIHADVGLLSWKRAEAVPAKQYLLGSPELVVEILSPSNTDAEVREKKRLCLENGSREFWVVDLDRCEVEVSTPNGLTVTYKAGQQIPRFFASGPGLPVDRIVA